MMTFRWANNKGFDDELVDHLIAWSMYPDVAQAIYGKKMRTVTHMEENGLIPEKTFSQLHHQRIEDIHNIFLTPIIPILKPPYGCAARIGVFIHLMQDQFYDEWIGSIISDIRNEDGNTFSYILRLERGTKEVSVMDILELKKWSWKEGTRYLYASSDVLDGSLKDSILWNQKNILERIEKYDYWHPAMSSYAKMYHEISLSGPDELPEIFLPHKQKIIDDFHNAIDSWELVVDRNLK